MASGAAAVMRAHKNVKTVLAQTSAVHGDFRLREFKFVAGENRTVTTHRE
jgi:tRNA G37 N-methylase Trm5